MREMLRLKFNLPLSLFLILLSFPGIVRAQLPNRQYTIQIKDNRIAPVANAAAWLDTLAHAREPIQLLVQFYDIPTARQRSELAAAGVELGDYLPEYSYIAFVTPPVRKINVSGSGIRSFIRMNPSWKIDKGFLNGLNLQAANKIRTVVRFREALSQAGVEELVKAYGGTVTDKRFAQLHTYEIELPQNKLLLLSGSADVRYLGAPARQVPLNTDGRAASYPALLQAPVSQGGYGLDGSGVTIGIGDNTGSIYHADTRDRTINFNTEPPVEHGQHTAGTAAGAGIIDPRARGMAPGVSVLSMLYNIVWAQTQYLRNDYNMTLTNNSYASVVGDCSFAGTYDLYSQMLDDYSNQFSDVEHIFASANDGLMTCGSYPQGFAAVAGSYQASKNVLVVGATGKNEVIWPKSSKGPVKDGRLKPEIVGFGFQVYSDNAFDQFTVGNGTSMSCPQITGALALLTQEYKQLHANANPKGSLLKVLAMNGATDLGNPGPDYTFGFGLLNLYHSIEMMVNNRYMVDSLSNGSNHQYTVSVPANTAQLKIMLYWHDRSASPLAANALVNNLDLEVTDPATGIHRPLILDPAPAAVTNNAVEGVDNSNNVEQVVINNPPAGNYTIHVKGTMIPAGKQEYIVAYDFLPVGLKLSYPITGEPVKAGDSVKVYWEASEDPGLLTLEYSTNNGSSWTTVSSTIPAGQRYYNWEVPNISSEQCMMRIKRGAQLSQSGVFTINPQPAVQLAADQCPGYISINWNAVTNATGYEILQKKGPALQPVDTVTAINYVLSGLSPDSLYYVVVRPLINGVRGYRSLAVSRRPNDGSCIGNISDGDLRAAAILAPSSGRKLTGTALTASETLSVLVSNLDDITNNNFRISYNINGGAWQSQDFNLAIPATGSAVASISGLDFSATGDYTIRVAVKNLNMTDPVHVNDTVSRIVRQLNNLPVSLSNGFTDDFETAPRLTLYNDSLGFTSNEHWDYVNSADSGRLRTLVSDDVLIGGSRSMSMDILYNMPAIQNYFMGTFNLNAYNVASTEGRVEFDYKLHGTPKSLNGNEVWIRGGDNKPWIKFFTYDTTVLKGQTVHSGSLSLTAALTAAAQDFSSSFQLRFGQNDTSVIAANDYGNGITIDNFRLYNVNNDVQLVSILSPLKSECGLGADIPLTVQVYNSDNLPQSNIQLKYRLDNGAVISEPLASIAAKDTVVFTFSQHLDLSAIGTHILDVWLIANGDTYTPNDSILQYRIRNQPLIASFPSLENFEASDGNWYAEGQNSSWQYGVPNTAKIGKAASGTKVWKTNLTGNYNDNENSFLYSPCYDISALTTPMLSFSMASDIENCASPLCDAAWLEFSYDGIVWTKLGTSTDGTNWYSDAASQVWNRQDDLRWHVASVLLPVSSQPIRLRFVFNSDVGTTREGMAIDDIHIFDRVHGIYDGSSVSASANAGSGQWTDFLKDGKLLAQVDPGTQDLGNTDVDLYTHAYVQSPMSHQYVLPENFVINSAQKPNNNVLVRLFVTDNDVVKMVNDNGCPNCSKAEDAYRLGITKYDDPDNSLENGSLLDNRNGTYSYFPYDKITWVPYDIGYYAEVGLSSFSELWFNTGIPGKSVASFNIYPNPAVDRNLNILWNAAPGTELELSVMDGIGKRVYSTTIAATDWDNRSMLYLPDVADGIYTVRYTIGGTKGETKLILGRR